ncbi:MAG TPA: hypothetical protein VIO60_01270 [Rectinemataceae bacterium]
MRFWLKLGVFLALLALAASCATIPEPSSRDTNLDNQGRAENLPTPAWVPMMLVGDIGSIESLPAYSGTLVVVSLSQAQELEKAQTLASRLRPETEMGYHLALRIDKLLREAKVPGSDYLSYNAYREEYIQAVSESLYTDFIRRGSWWIKSQTYLADGSPGMQVYRVYQLWSVEKKYLRRQLQAILASVHGELPSSPENLRARNIVQNTLDRELFGL